MLTGGTADNSASDDQARTVPDALASAAPAVMVTRANTRVRASRWGRDGTGKDGQMARRKSFGGFPLPEVELSTHRSGRQPDAIVLPVHPASTTDDDVEASPTVGGDYPASAALAAVLPLAIDALEHTGAAGTRAMLPRPGERPERVVLIGIGAAEPDDLRAWGAAAARAMSDRRTAVIALPTGIAPEGLRAAVEGMLLASYSYDLSSDAEQPTLRRIRLLAGDDVDVTALDAAIRAAVAVATATATARDLVNTPGDRKTPGWLADRSVEVAAEHGIQADVRDPSQLADDGFAGLAAVGRGSDRGPRLVRLRWAPRRARTHVVLVGKGITFDSGGISIKPNGAMTLMKKDMGGAAAVLGAIAAVAALRLPIRVTALLPIAENLPGEDAWRPGDVIRHYGGITSEVQSTDAEGRVVMADVLAYASSRLRPDYLIDLATLTGGQSVSLGKKTAALMAPTTELADALTSAAERAGESVWRLPLSDDYEDLVHGDTADLTNTSGNPQTITAGLYLRRFAGASADRWAHLDMSGPAWSGESAAELSKGATGWGVRTLVRWLEAMVDETADEMPDRASSTGART